MSITIYVWEPAYNAGMPFTAALVPLLPALFIVIGFMFYFKFRKKVVGVRQ